MDTPSDWGAREKDPEHAASQPMPDNADEKATASVASRPVGDHDRTRAESEFKAGMTAWLDRKMLDARDHLNLAMQLGLPEEKAKAARESLTEVAERTLFSSAILDNDPLVGAYVVKSGDTLGKIAKRYHVTEELLAQVNVIPDKNFIRMGQRLKVLRGPFHAAVSKSSHELHIYLQDVYVRTYPVALGTDGSTPLGRWRVANRQQNPSWVNPRTGERWHADDPENPIGEFWLGLEGIEEATINQFGYGIHGTIEPETIGQDVSMGCVRLVPEDIAQVYKLLVPEHSLVMIVK